MDEAQLKSLRKKANLYQSIAGWIWTAGNLILPLKAGLNADQVLVGSGFATTAASTSVALFANRANWFSGPTFLVSGSVFTGEHIRMALETGSSSEYADSAFGIGVEAGIAVIYYGRQIKKMLEKSPAARLMGKLPRMEQGTIAQIILTTAYAFEIGGSAAKLYHGIMSGDQRAMNDGFSGLGLITLYLTGNWCAGRAANLRNELERLKTNEPASAIPV